MLLLRQIFKDINEKNSPYKNIYYLTDTEVRFSINDDKNARILTYSIRKENNKYIAYGFEKYQISDLSSVNNNRQEIKEINNSDEFWKWYLEFYNNN